MISRANDRTTLPELDRDGYLVDADKWTREVAEILAQREAPQSLSEDHWRVIDFLRQYYLEMGSAPPVRLLARKTGLSLRDLKKLFPDGLARSACKYSGMPYRVVTKVYY